MSKLNKILWALVLCAFISIPSVCLADESAIFSAPNPDLLIAVDLSGSMNWVPSGQYMFMANGVATSNCTAAAST